MKKHMFIKNVIANFFARTQFIYCIWFLRNKLNFVIAVLIDYSYYRIGNCEQLFGAYESGTV